MASSASQSPSTRSADAFHSAARGRLSMGQAKAPMVCWKACVVRIQELLKEVVG